MLIATEHVRLCPLSVRHVWAFWQIMGNPHARAYLGGPTPPFRRIRQFFGYLKDNADGQVWGVQSTQNARAVGFMFLSPLSPVGEVEVSYLFDPSAWGKGIAGNALAAVVAHGFEHLKADSIVAITQTANERSCRLLRGAGFIERVRFQQFGAEQAKFVLSNASQP